MQPPDAKTLDSLVQAVTVISHVIIAFAYFAIPGAMAWVLVRHPVMQFRWLGWLFVNFIAACGITHLASAYAIFSPIPLLLMILELGTAMISLFTAILLWIFLDQCGKILDHPIGGHSHE